MKLLFLALASLAAAQEQSRPVAKAIKMLNDMSAQLQAEQKADEEAFEKLKCWCKTNRAEKEQAVKVANKRIDAYSGESKEMFALANQLKAEINKLKDERANNDAALREAQALRDKQLSEFNAADKELTESIRQLKGAITTLSKHNSLVQVPEIAGVLREQMKKHGDLLKNLTPQVTALLDAPAGFNSYNSRSGEIFGILKQMQETFENDLSDETKTEQKRAQAFAQLKDAKNNEIAAQTEAIDTKTVQKADAKKRMAEADQGFADMTDALAADQEFLADLNDKCAMTDAEMEERTKTRQAEMAAVAEATKVLNSEEAHALFAKSVNNKPLGQFIQTSSEEKLRAKALKVLSTLKKSAEITALTMAVKLDGFDKVKKAIDDLVAELKQAQKDEVDKRDACNKQLNDNAQATAQEEAEAARQTATVDSLVARIEKLTADVAAATAENAELMKQMKAATIQREEANQENLQTINDQRATQQVLDIAVQRLRAFYDPDVTVEGETTTLAPGQTAAPVMPAAVFVQISQEPGAEVEAAPGGFATYSNNSGGMVVITKLKEIIQDSKEVEEQTSRDEQNEQAAYESFTRDTNDAVKNNNKAISENNAAIADSTEEKIQATRALEAANANLKNLKDENSAVHKDCDFVLNNFSMRQEARSQEIEALGEVKAILSGKGLSFLQRY